MVLVTQLTAILYAGTMGSRQNLLSCSLCYNSWLYQVDHYLEQKEWFYLPAPYLPRG